MDNRKGRTMSKKIITMCVLVMGTVIYLAGCEKKADASDAGIGDTAAAKRVWTCSMHPEIKEEKARKCNLCGMDLILLVPDAEEAAEAVSEQTLCPVMNQQINKELFTEYNGRKVYFCCPGCEETFLKDPEKYLGKLPQFQN
jgi:YHS domain-containing protein